MKKQRKTTAIVLPYLLVFMGLLWTDTLFGQWTTNGNNIYYNSGFVGVGLENPIYNLDVYDQDTPLRSTLDLTGEDGFRSGFFGHVKGNATGEIRGIYSFMQCNVTGADIMGIYLNNNFSSSDQTVFGVYATGEDANYFSGNIGLGTDNPQQELVIKSTRPNIVLSENDGNSAVLEYHEGADQLRFQHYINEGANWVSTLMALDHDNGHVGIGTVDPLSDLHVEGSEILLSNNSNALNFRTDINGDSFISNKNNFMGNGSSTNRYLTVNGQSQLRFNVGDTGNFGTEVMRITNQERVGIGIDTPESKLHVKTNRNRGIFQEMVSESNNSVLLGIQNNITDNANSGGITGYISKVTSSTTSPVFGSSIQVSGEGTGNRYGQTIRMSSNITGDGFIRGLEILMAQASSDQEMYGIYVSGADKNYFSGNVGIETIFPAFNLDVNGTAGVTGGVWSGSDKRWKKNIQNIEEPLQKLKRLNGKKYDWRKKEFPDKNFGNTHQIGFLAQEVQEVFPELVKENKEGYLSINYSGLIPVLVEALKEQQALIETLQEEVSGLKNTGQTLKSQDFSNTDSPIFDANGKAELFQNVPNPFEAKTEISFYLPQQVQRAEIIVYDMRGAQLQVIPITGRGESSVNINGYSLKPGIYLYALVADGTWIDTKRMLLK